jgi:hypothetical protein
MNLNRKKYHDYIRKPAPITRSEWLGISAENKRIREEAPQLVAYGIANRLMSYSKRISETYIRPEHYTPEEKRDAVLQLRKEGNTYEKIQKITGVNARYIAGILHSK